MTPDELEQLAGRLTAARRRCLLILSDQAQFPGRSTFNSTAAFNMIRMGITAIGFDRKVMRETFRLTPLGLALRQHLIERTGR